MVIFNNETLKQAVKEWIDNPDTAKTKYGHISDWDVSNVTSMRYLFDALLISNSNLIFYKIRDYSDNQINLLNLV